MGVRCRSIRYAKAAAVAVFGWAGAALAFGYTELDFGDSAVVSADTGVTDTADYVRMVRLNDGRLVVAWLDAAGPVDSAWDLEGNLYRARDVFLSLSADDGVTWSAAVNVSNTAQLTDPSEVYDPVGDGVALLPYYGDSDKASLFAVGNNLVVAWNDKYCGNGRHGPAVYADFGGVEVPFGCEYAARVTVGAAGFTIVAVDRLTDGSRDATAEMLRGVTAGFALAWQEDPLGLQPGEEKGDGEGASGARVTPGTDIWYSFMSNASFQNAGSVWSAPNAISNNYDYTGGVALEGGASRVIFGLAGTASTVVLAYEEAKNAGATDPGKNVILHTFPFNAPDVRTAGTIVNAIAENSRRARIVTQGTPGSQAGLRSLLMWRQGTGIEGAPGDLVARVGRVAPGVNLAAQPDAGFRAVDLWPPVDVIDPNNNTVPLNLSAAALDESTSQNALEDARAHRAVLDGDFIYAGYTYVPDSTAPGAVYELMVRRSFDGGTTWDAPVAVSAAVPHTTDVIEPRLMRTPPTVASGLPEDVRDPNVYVVAWGLEAGTGPGGAPVSRSLWVTRTKNGGQSFEPVQPLGAATPDLLLNEGAQLQVRPDGNEVYAVWRQVTTSGAEAAFARGVEVERVADVSVTALSWPPVTDIGVPAAFTFALANAGPDTATSAQFVLDLAPEFSVVSATIDGGACTLGANVTCTVASLTSQASASVVVTLTGQVPGTFNFAAVVNALESDPNAANNSLSFSTAVRAVADLGIALRSSATAPVKKGKLLTITLDVINGGPQEASGVQVVTTLPAILEFRSAPGCSAAGSVVTCSVSQIAPSGTATIPLDVVGVGVGTGTVTASVAATQYDPEPANNAGAVEVAIKRGGGGGGCAYAPGAAADLTLPLLLLGALVGLNRRRRCGQTG